MKNIEKYKETKDALEAWRQSVEVGVYLSFDEWAQREYEATRAPTLLEAAEAVTNTWNAKMPYGSLSRVATTIGHLADAIASEKRKPVRNLDRFATADEAAEAYECFRKFCSKVSCSECRFFGRGIPCVLAWLYEEAEKEEGTK